MPPSSSCRRGRASAPAEVSEPEVSGFLQPSLSNHLQRFERCLTYFHAAILLTERLDRRLERGILDRRAGADAADHHIGNRIHIFVLTHVALDSPFDVRAVDHLVK